ncbi:hypothetical protein D3C81_815230 [compost metagenome]
MRLQKVGQAIINTAPLHKLGASAAQVAGRKGRHPHSVDHSMLGIHPIRYRMGRTTDNEGLLAMRSPRPLMVTADFKHAPHDRDRTIRKRDQVRPAQGLPAPSLTVNE